MGTITVVLPAEDRWFYNELSAGAVARITSAGHRAEVCRVDADGGSPMAAAACIEEAFAADDGLGAIAAGFPYRGSGKERFLAWRRPVVIVGGSTLGFPVVSFDDVGVGRTITQHLIGLGHQRIVHLTGSLDPETAFIFLRRRARGYRMSMESAGLRPAIVESVLGAPGLEGRIRDMLSGADRPTAVFAAYDEIAFTVMRVAAELGLRVGEDLSVAGVNDHPDAAGLGLTTARHKPNEVGAAAVEMILEGLTPGLGSSKSRLQPSTFVHRGSTRRLSPIALQPTG